MKKIRLINPDCEEVVNKGELDSLRENYRQCQRHIMHCAYGEVKYTARKLDEYSDIYIVCAEYPKFRVYIKYFLSDDAEYNRICAEELVELLNQRQ